MCKKVLTGVNKPDTTFNYHSKTGVCKMIRLLTATILVAGCSYTPVADLRVSGDKAQLYQRDLVECRQLVKQAQSLWQFGGHVEMLNKCLRGRGHNVIGA